MSKNCHSGSCNIHSQSGSKSCGCCSDCGCEGNCSSGCGCGCSDCKCGSNCGCGSKACGSCGDFSAKLIQMADDAWMCLLKEKIRDRVEKANGKHLDELADIVATANHERWKEKLKAKEACDEFHEKIADFFKK